jgi:hypothetical protein
MKPGNVRQDGRSAVDPKGAATATVADPSPPARRQSLRGAARCRNPLSGSPAAVSGEGHVNVGLTAYIRDRVSRETGRSRRPHRSRTAPNTPRSSLGRWHVALFQTTPAATIGGMPDDVRFGSRADHSGRPRIHPDPSGAMVVPVDAEGVADARSRRIIGGSRTRPKAPAPPTHPPDDTDPALVDRGLLDLYAPTSTGRN